MAKLIAKSTTDQIETPHKTWQISILGLFLGLLFWCFSGILKHWFLADLSGDIATIIVATIGLLVMAFAKMNQPLLIALATAVALWGLVALTVGLDWHIILMWDVILYGISYSLFGWLSSYHRLGVVVFISVIIVALIRFIAMSAMIQ